MPATRGDDASDELPAEGGGAESEGEVRQADHVCARDVAHVRDARFREFPLELAVRVDRAVDGVMAVFVDGVAADAEHRESRKAGEQRAGGEDDDGDVEAFDDRCVVVLHDASNLFRLHSLACGTAQAPPPSAFGNERVLRRHLVRLW